MAEAELKQCVFLSVPVHFSLPENYSVDIGHEHMDKTQEQKLAIIKNICTYKISITRYVNEIGHKVVSGDTNTETKVTVRASSGRHLNKSNKKYCNAQNFWT